MQHITPHLWFDKEAREAAEFYASAIPDSAVTNVTRLTDTPSGDCDVVSFTLAGQPFMAISAGPLFRFNPSISFHIRCETAEEVDAIWGRLAEGASVLMPLGSYPFSPRFGWLADRFGVSWQVIQTADAARQRIAPMLLFVGGVCGRAEEAMNFYAAVFRGAPGAGGEGASVNVVSRYGPGEAPDKEGTVRYGQFTLAGQEFGAMDSAHGHAFTFNEAVSLLVPCESQEEIDYFWDRLAADPEAGQCGWLKDKFGVSWQVNPTILGRLLGSGDWAQRERVTRAFLKMKKFDIAELERAAGAR